ncbi:DUF3231 family protein [Brevibacillus humidisoli]|uniref:DUF3231 family protein n=1 Tax=Brevibacillus humidisoli TaxID=2895522 RepID=UPI001E456A06|nr:DUF3231 family protein [Brevibacillus humidisoli]UFJ41811.1 DUF3231 family protein [Brevibacillus humidisoli]
MPSVMEAVTSTMQGLMEKDPDQPLHIGEAMACWTYRGALKEAIVMEQTGLNTTTDDELKHILNEAIEMCSRQVERLDEFMKQEGVPIPPTSPSRPQSDPSAVPLGVKANDPEIANGIAAKVASAITACATAAAGSVRNDVGLMWTEFQAEQLTFAATLKNVMRKRGWLMMPPPFTPPGVPGE